MSSTEATKTGHTPGPWRVFGYEVVDAKDQRVASTTTPSRPHPEERANACLIAAAPELLKAAKDVMRAFGFAPPEEVDLYTEWDALATAIAKAEGCSES